MVRLGQAGAAVRRVTKVGGGLGVGLRGGGRRNHRK